ncbi:IS3 family transposase [Leucobacter sp. cx-169]|nr:IS3 family transposase [Leucobacter sp. cx-169]
MPTQLSNLQKTQVVEALRQLFPLRLLLEFARLQPSSYQYCRQVLDRPQAHVKLRAMIRDIASASSYTYGSPRVWLALRKSGTQVSEKVVRRLMKEERIPVFYARRKRRYSSYEGKLTPAPIDQVNREFHANEPNRLWVTDVSEFPAPDGKVYLSPMIDCFDGKIVSWRMHRSPNMQLTQGMLEDAIHTLPESYRAELRAQENPSRLTIHTDRGGHYRGGEWIEGMKSAGLTRSMGRKGNSGDNAACEGFFGRMKTEILYGRTWKTANQIESAISAYMHFYNNTRIRTVLGGATIAEYREALEAELSKEQS